MRPLISLDYGWLGELADSLLTDFILSFVFFTALSYAVLAKRFGQQRSATAMSAAIGFSLSIGLVWWEQTNGLSIRDLGPIAVGAAIIMLAAVVFQAFRQVGGTWSGAGMALGASLLVGKLLEVDWPLDARIVQTVTVVSLTAGGLAYLLSRTGRTGHTGRSFGQRPKPATVRHDVRDLRRDRNVSRQLGRRFQKLRKATEHPLDRPGEAGDVLVQLKRMLPAEGWLTERLTELRAKAHRVRKGHVARIEKLRDVVGGLSAEGRKKAAKELRDRYKELRLDSDLARLDKAVAEAEERISGLTVKAKQLAAAHDHKALYGVLKQAEKLQKRSSSLFRLIESTEKKLMKVAEKAARDAREVGGK